ncbi:MAG: hypothetical protein P8X91_01575 [Candidatus Bathyarchaeota archaeon]
MTIFNGVDYRMNEFNNLTKQKIVTKTFRLRNEYAEILEEEAEKQGISTSTLLDKLLRNSHITETQIVKSWIDPA